MLRQPLAALVGEAVFLQATVGLVGDSHFNQAIGQGRFEVAFAERFAIQQAEGGLQRLAARLSLDRKQQLTDLGGDLRRDLGGGGGHGIQNHPQHEVDEGHGVGLASALLQGLVILGLMLENQAFHRNIGKQWGPAGQDQALPQPPHAAVAVGKGMYEFEFVVKDCAGDERVGVASGEPAEQVAHQLWHPVCRGSHVDHLLTRHHAYAATPVGSGLVDQPGHQDTMCLQQILFDFWPPGVEAVISGQSVTHFQNLPGWSDDPFPIQDGCDLLFGQGVPLDSQRPVNCTDATDASQSECSDCIGQDSQTSHSLAYPGDQINDGWGDSVRRLILLSHGASRSLLTLSAFFSICDVAPFPMRIWPFILVALNPAPVSERRVSEFKKSAICFSSRINHHRRRGHEPGKQRQSVASHDSDGPEEPESDLREEKAEDQNIAGRCRPESVNKHAYSYLIIIKKEFAREIPT